MEDDEILQEFLTESRESLDSLDLKLVELEESGDEAHITEIFRCVHTIKGACGFFDFTKLEKLAHTGENLLDKLRQGQLQVNEEITTALLSMVDSIRASLEFIQATGHEGQEEHLDLIEALAQLVSQNQAPLVEAEAPKAPSTQTGAPAKKAKANASKDNKDSKDNSVRINVQQLDTLMNLVGELVLARNQTLQYANAQNDSIFAATVQRLNLITTELQEGIMKTRMQPIKNVWGRYPRLVRDLSVELDKSVRLEMEGEDTDLDRTLLDAIKDPLIHIVRNAIDHGFETRDERTRVGKPEVGVLSLRAFHEGGQVNIEIADDGRGIDPQKLRDKAVEKSVLSRTEADGLSDRDALNLIFHPGFSTAEKITNLSGRGVGMDVVRSNIDKIGGSIDVHSTLGMGTSLKLKIPLTLAIIPALIITCAGERFAIPQVNLVELLRLTQEQLRNRLEFIHNAPVCRLRGRLLPLLHLSEQLGFTTEGEDPFEGREEILLVVLQAGEQLFGLVVDEIKDTEEIVVKPLSRQLKHLDCFAGASILGDGRVVLILDALGLARSAGMLSEQRYGQEADHNAQAEVDTVSLLLFRLHESGQMAMPLERVSRLEELPCDRIEYAGQKPVIQYREQILPLVDLRRYFSPPSGARAGQDQDPFQVIVCNHHGQMVGLIVGEILDIVDKPIKTRTNGTRRGVYFSAVIQGSVTEVIDVTQVVESTVPEFLQADQIA